MLDSDLDIDDDEVEDYEKQFELATNHVMRNSNVYKASDLLELYGLYKQATEGACNIPRPTFLQMKARSKWSAWKELGDMTRSDAQRAYTANVLQLDPNCLDKEHKSKDGRGDVGGRSSGWAVHSIEAMPVEAIKLEHQKTVFDHVKENNLERLRAELQPTDLTNMDDQGMALLHWATDRNAIEIIKYLIESGANVNQRDAEQQTALHYAASCGHVEALRCLLSLNADLELLDAEGQTCIDVADNEQICATLKAELQMRQGLTKS